MFTNLPTSKLLKLFMLAALPILAFSAEINFDALNQQRQERLYYDVNQLKDSVQSLIAADIPIGVMAHAYDIENDEIKRFNIIIILDKKIKNNEYKENDRVEAIEILKKAIKAGNPWIRTEAIYALGNAKCADAQEIMNACLDDPSATVTFHAVIAIQNTFGIVPELTESQKLRMKTFMDAESREDGKNKLADKELAEYRRSDYL